MFIVSNVELVTAACKSGIVGSFPSLNGRHTEDFEAMLQKVQASLDDFRATHPDKPLAPYAVNITVRILGSERSQRDIAALKRYKVPIVITSVGNPRPVVDEVHDYGGLVFHDVVSMKH